MEIWKEYRNIVQVCRDKIRKPKVKIKFNMAKEVEDIKKGIYKYADNKQKTSENIGSLVNETETWLQRLKQRRQSVLSSFPCPV